MRPDEAQELYLSRVYAPTLLQKLAAAGVKVDSEEDLVHHMSTISMLKLAKQQLNVEADNPVKQAHDLLKEAMFGQQVATPALDESLVEAAAALTKQE